MSEPVRFALQDLDLRNRTILDAAIGAAESTVHWARAIHEQGGTSRIIAVDNDLNQMWQDRVHKTLGEYDRYVESHDADIFDLDFIEHGSIDIINCHDTVVFLNDPPLRLIAAFREFDRVLKPAGLLFITSEDPVSLSDNPDNEGQWRRWQFNKTLAALKGEDYSSEPLAENVRAVPELLGLEVYDHLAVAPGKWSEGLAEWIGEWREDSLKEIEALPWPWLKQALRRTADEVHDKVLSDGFCMCPAQYVLKCRKPGAAEAGQEVSPSWVRRPGDSKAEPVHCRQPARSGFDGQDPGPANGQAAAQAALRSNRQGSAERPVAPGQAQAVGDEDPGPEPAGLPDTGGFLFLFPAWSIDRAVVERTGRRHEHAVRRKLPGPVDQSVVEHVAADEQQRPAERGLANPDVGTLAVDTRVRV